MSLFVISDPHGCKTELEELLTLIPYEAGRDRLLFLGDYVDRGPSSRGVIDVVRQRIKEEGARAIIGNHDWALLMFCADKDPSFDRYYLHGGGRTTVESFLGEGFLEYNPEDDTISTEKMHQAKVMIRTEHRDHLKWLSKLPFYLSGQGHVFVHAGLNPTYGMDFKSQPEQDFIWIREEFWNQPTTCGQTVVFGHTVTRYLPGRDGTDSSIWFADKKIGIDGGCVFGYQLNCLQITDDNQYISYNVKAKDAHHKDWVLEKQK